MYINNLDKNEYDKFVAKCDQHHFLRSTRWAEFRRHIGWEHVIVGLKENDELTIAAIILLKKTPKLPYKIAYTSRGYVKTEGANEALFLAEVKKHLKSLGAILYKIDPDEVYANLDDKLNRIDEPKDQRIAELKNYGFNHLGFLDNFEGMNPRHTIRIDTNKDYQAVLDNMPAKTRGYERKVKENGLVIEEVGAEKLDIFMKLLNETSERDAFTIRDKSYFEAMFEIYKDDLILTLARVDFKAMLENHLSEIEVMTKEYQELEEKINNEGGGKKQKQNLKNLQTRLNDLSSKTDEFTKAAEEHPDGLYLAGNLTIIEGNKSWYIYGATSSSYRYLRPAYAMLFKRLEHACNTGQVYYDLFGIAGFVDKDSDVYGLYQFKRVFGGENIEFIGEFDMPIKSLPYFGFNVLYPKLKKLRKGRK